MSFLSSIFSRLLFSLFRREGSLGRDFLISHDSRILSVDFVAQQAERTIHLAVQREKLVGRAHPSHVQQDCGRIPLGAVRETHFTDAPHILGHNQIARYQLETRIARDKKPRHGYVPGKRQY